MEKILAQVMLYPVPAEHSAPSSTEPPAAPDPSEDVAGDAAADGHGLPKAAVEGVYFVEHYR